MEIEIGSEYTKEEIAAFYGCSLQTYRKNNRYEEHLKKFYNVEECRVRGKYGYKILSSTGIPWEAYQKCRKTSSRKKVLQPAIVESVRKHPYNYVVGITDDIEEKAQDGLADSTFYRYTCEEVKEMYGSPLAEKQGTHGIVEGLYLCRMNDAGYYEEVPYEDKQLWRELRNNMDQNDIDYILSSPGVEVDDKPRRIANLMRDMYKKAEQEFFNIKGYVPQMVPKRINNGIKIREV